jgi:hypothetical protein
MTDFTQYKSLFSESALDSTVIPTILVQDLYTDRITGLSSANQLRLLGSLITNINSSYLALLNQDVSTNGIPLFSGIKIWDVTKSKYYTLESQVSLADNRLCLFPLLLADDTFVFQNHSQELKNKTINSDLNSMSNIANGNIKSTAGIDAYKLIDGSVSNLSLGYIAGLDQPLSTDSFPSFLGISLYDQTGNLGKLIDIRCPFTLLADHTIYIPNLGNTTDTFVLELQSQEIKNKTINGTLNTISNIGDGSISSGINANKIANGTISNTEFQYLNGLDQYLDTAQSVSFGTINVWDNGGLGNHRNTITQTNTTTGDRTLHIPLITTPNETFVFQDFIQSLTNKTISASANTISNIVDACIASNANIAFSKIADCLYSSTMANRIVGYTSGASLSSGSPLINSIYGDYCMPASTAGTYCSLFGYGNLYQVSGATQCVANTCIGPYNLYSQTGNSTYNMILGGQSLQYSTTSAQDQNTLIGYEALQNCTSACNYNFLLGFRCLYNITTGYVRQTVAIGSSLTANGATNQISNVLALIGGVNQTLRASPLTNYIQLGNSSHTQLYIPGTMLNTDGILTSASHIISSTNSPSVASINTDQITNLTAGGTLHISPNGTGQLSIDEQTTFNNVDVLINTGYGLYTNEIHQKTASAKVSMVDGIKCDVVAEYTGSASVTMTNGIKSDVVAERTNANGVLVDQTTIKDNGFLMVEGSGSPTGVNAGQANLYLRNDVDQSLVLSDDSGNDVTVCGAKACAHYHEYSTPYGWAVFGSEPTVTDIGSSFVLASGSRGVTKTDGKRKTVTSVTDPGGGKITLNWTTSDSSTKAQCVQLTGFSVYTNGIYLVTASTGTSITITQTYSATDTGTIIFGDEFKINQTGFTAVSFEITTQHNGNATIKFGYILNGTVTYQVIFDYSGNTINSQHFQTAIQATKDDRVMFFMYHPTSNDTVNVYDATAMFWQ